MNLSNTTRICIVIFSLFIHMFVGMLVWMDQYTQRLQNSVLTEKIDALKKTLNQESVTQPWKTIVRTKNAGAPVILVANYSNSVESTSNMNLIKESEADHDSTVVHDTMPHVNDTIVEVEDDKNSIPLLKQSVADKKEKSSPLEQKNILPAPRYAAKPEHKHQPPPDIPSKVKPSLSFEQLVEGFAKHMQTEGCFELTMIGKGKDNAKLTELQLVEGRFLYKIASSIESSWAANSGKYPFLSPMLASIYFTLSIKKNGTLDKITITRSSGNSSLDRFVLDILQDSCSTFPAIPASFGWKICTVRIRIDDMIFPSIPHFIVGQF